MKIVANLTKAEEYVVSPAQPSDSPRVDQADSTTPRAGPGNPWNYSTVTALLFLVAVWAYKLYMTWGAWGNLTIDSGHEMYVPAMLAQGKELYRDLWFPFGPAAPYFNSYLFRLFGLKLVVLYWAGSFSALGSAIFLYLTGMRLGSWLIGWGAGAVVLLEAFQPSVFCFPLPYSFSAVYGCFAVCVFVWLSSSACFFESRRWMFWAGITASVALLLKPEFGLAAYSCLGLFVGSRWLSRRSWGQLSRDLLAILPGIAICGLVIRWMVSIAGAEFIAQENIQSWPTSYFMRTYGKTWLALNGFTISSSAFLDAFYRAIPVFAVVLASMVFLRWRKYDQRSVLTRALIAFALALYLIKNNYFLLDFNQNMTQLLSTVFFPRDMVLYTILGAVAAWIYLWRRPALGSRLALPLLFTFSGVLAFRVLMKMNWTTYPIYYNGPVVLCYLLLLSRAIPRSTRSRPFVLLAEAALVLACLFPVYENTRAVERGALDFVPLATGRGTVRTSKNKAIGYTAALQFMKEKAALGQSVLSVPEDTSLYFLSETECPTRAYLFIPGLVAPGKMTRDTIAEIERKPVDYLLWSNRTFSEYGAAKFGEDFNAELGGYLKSHYRPLQPLVPTNADSKTWNAVIWERRPLL